MLEENEEIAKKFNVESFPSVVVIRPDSDPLVIATPDFTEDLSILYDTFTEQLGIKTSHNWSQQKHMGDFALEIKGKDAFDTKFSRQVAVLRTLFLTELVEIYYSLHLD